MIARSTSRWCQRSPGAAATWHVQRRIDLGPPVQHTVQGDSQEVLPVPCGDLPELIEVHHRVASCRPWITVAQVVAD